MSSDFQRYCDVTESLAFQSSELNSSSSFQASNCRPMVHNRLKCFNCFGNDQQQQYCSHCGGTNFITDKHPLALLFNDVFQRKLGLVPSQKEAVSTEFQDVQTIKQEEQELDDRKILCDICNKECDLNYKYYCQCCECFFVCVKCADQKQMNEIHHSHPLATNKNIPNSLFSIKRTTSKHLGSNQKKQLHSSNSDSQKINITDYQQKCNLQVFNVYDIIEKQNSHTYGNQAQNDSCDNSEYASGPDFRMLQTFRFKNYKRVELQSSDQGIKHTSQIQNNHENLAKSMKSSQFDFLNELNNQVRQSFDINVFGRESMAQSVGNRESFGLCFENYIQQHCSNCGAQLKEVYQICQTCQQLKKQYKICCQCQDNKLYTHDENHQMDLILGNLLRRGESDMVSKKFIDSDQQNHLDEQVPQIRRKKSSLEKRPPRLDQCPFDQGNSGKKSFSKLKSSGSLGISFQYKQTKIKTFEDQSIVNLQCSGLFESTEFKECQTIKLVQKKSSLYEVNNSFQEFPHSTKFNNVKDERKVTFNGIESDDDNPVITYIHSESQQEQVFHFQQKKIQKTTIKNSKGSFKDFKSVKSMVFSKHEDRESISLSRQGHSSIKYSQSSIKLNHKPNRRQYQSEIVEQTVQVKQKIQFIHQYSCDQCGCSHIKNIRYHCLECEDFDLCEDCYNVKVRQKHNHRFQKIDGLKKLQEKRIQALQKKDPSKNRDSMLKSSNIGMLTKSKKTIELMKSNIQHLGTTISNLGRSYNTFVDFYGQRSSFKSRIQNY